MTTTTDKCKNGHVYTEESTYYTPKWHQRGCLTCRKESIQRARDRTNFDGNRDAAIERDGGKCVKCGMTREEHRKKIGRDITVDHIDDNGVNKPRAMKNNNLDNLQTLCLPCHAAKDNRSKTLTDEQVIEIRRLGGTMTNRKIASLYGVSDEYVRQLLLGLWRRDLLPEEQN